MANQTGAIKENAEKFGKEIEDKANTMGQAGAESAHEVADSVKSQVENISGKARGVAAKAKDGVTDVYENLDGYISERPMQSFLIGLGVGCVVGVTLTALLKR